jgi:nicotinamidase-related amidase
MPMPRRSPDLHRRVPEDSAAAMILLDVISDFEFPDAEKLLQPAASVLPNLLALKARAREAGIPII